MASDQLQRCKWEGCFSCNVTSGDLYCREHKPLSAMSSSPANERKQLPGVKHTARKSVQQTSTVVGQARSGSTKSPIRKSKDLSISSMELLPAKRQRLSGLSNGLGFLPRSAGTSFAENGIPHSPKRGMFRQPEERPYMLSAIDDFALRPKKNEAGNESALNDQRQLYQRDRHSSSSQPISSAPKPSQKPSPNGHVYAGADSTGNHNSYTFNGIAVEQQKHQKTSDGSLSLPYEQSSLMEFANEQWGQMPNPQSVGVVQAQQEHPIERDSKNPPQIPKNPQKMNLSAPSVTSPIPVKRITITLKKLEDIPTPNNNSGPVHMDTTTSIQQDSTKGRQLSNEIHRSPLGGERLAPINADVSVSGTDKVLAENPIKSIEEATPSLDASMTPQASTTIAESQSHNNATQPAAQTVEPEPAAISIKQPLSALLGGRKWKDMHPEERRLFWVSQHDPEKLDAQIYSEHNRPFRPGDASFRRDYNALPPRPTRPATHFGYVNPKSYSFHQQSEEWYQQKQKEISARGNRKANLGEAIARATQRKRAIPKVTQREKQDRLPKRVRDTPKWLAALKVIEKLEAQNRARLTPKISGANTSLVSDADVGSADIELS